MIYGDGGDAMNGLTTTSEPNSVSGNEVTLGCGVLREVMRYRWNGYRVDTNGR